MAYLAAPRCSRHRVPAFLPVAVLNARTAVSDPVPSGGGSDQADPQVVGEVDASVIGKHAAVGNTQDQLPAPHLMHLNIIAHALNVRRDVPAEFYLANPDRTALAR